MRDAAERRTGVVLGAIVGAAFLLRLAGIFNDFWLDEIWAWVMARAAKSAWDIVAHMHIDGNHFLNTLILRWLGDRAWWPVYRLHSVAAGTASVAAVAAVARRWGKVESLAAASLAASSWLLVLCGSEARGYALVILFSLLSFLAMSNCFSDRRLSAVAKLNGLVLLGFLSTLAFFECYFALASWSAWHFLRAEKGWRGAAVRWSRCHALPLAFIGLLYFGHMRGMTTGGGPLYSAGRVARETIDSFFGAPDWPTGAWALGAVVLALVVRELARLRREGSDEWVFFGSVLLVVPALVLGLNPMRFLYVRYFLLNLAFLIVLLSRPLADALRAGGRRRSLCAAALCLYLFGNGRQLAAFYRYGRGQYSQALRVMAEGSPSGEVTVGSANDFTINMILSFYARFLPAGKRLSYVQRARWTPSSPQWAVVLLESRDLPPPPELTTRAGARYDLVRPFFSGEQSGENWLLYRLELPSR